MKRVISPRSVLVVGMNIPAPLIWPPRPTEITRRIISIEHRVKISISTNCVSCISQYQGSEQFKGSLAETTHTLIISININNTICTADKSAVTVTDIYAWDVAIKSAGSDVADTDAFCRIEGFF